mmetsp:Transcript_84437/g.117375  ORF Transcript_84437/g.117375 Transcript_84437/m.117375 type:complete len:218 (+) Transcript_84437:123-776(+)
MPIHVSTRERLFHIPFKAFDVLTEHLCRLLVQRILHSRILENQNKTERNCLEIEHRVPILTQYIETDISVAINIWVVNVGLALDRRRLVWVPVTKLEVKEEFTTFPVTIIGFVYEFEIHQIVHAIVEDEFKPWRPLHFVVVLLHPQLSSSNLGGSRTGSCVSTLILLLLQVKEFQHRTLHSQRSLGRTGSVSLSDTFLTLEFFQLRIVHLFPHDLRP